MKVAILAIATFVAGPACADDNAIAYRLYSDGRFAEAAEIFTDPAWKGVAFYRSEQYWRAAEAFVRSDDPASIYNLGNAYAKLGYYELALEAYVNTVAREPGFVDAAANADIMRKLIAVENGGHQSGLTPPARKIGETEPSRDDKGGSGGDRQGEHGDAEERSADVQSQTGADTDKTPQQAQPSAGDANGASSEDKQQGMAGQQTISGAQQERDRQEGSAGGSTGAGMESSDIAIGARNRLETDQATEQWLNRIVDDPARFLKARIALESRRRAASGNQAPATSDPW